MLKQIDEFNYNYEVISNYKHSLDYNTKIYEVNLKSKQTYKLKNLKILHLSDTHFKNSKKQKKEYVKLKSLLKDEIFDLIIHTGDIVDKSYKCFFEEYKDFLNSLQSNLGKFFILGNHDYRDEKEIESKINSKKVIKIMESLNFKSLINSSVKLKYNDFAFNLIGLDDIICGKPDFEKATSQTKKTDFNILLTHNLDVIKKSQVDYFNLIFSGHLHAGEFNLGLFDGIMVLKLEGHYKNIHKQTKGFKSLGKNTLSFSHPGNFSAMTYKFCLPRMFTYKAGSVIINFE